MEERREKNEALEALREDLKETKKWSQATGQDKVWEAVSANEHNQIAYDSVCCLELFIL